MYQASIRDKKKHKMFNQQKLDNYDLDATCEDYAYVKKLLGNCRVQVITDKGVEAIGVIRGTLRKFNRRVIIEAGDIVVISKRDYQENKVDIVHKYNADQVQSLINENKMSTALTNYYNNSHVSVDTDSKTADDNYIDFGDISDASSNASD